MEKKRKKIANTRDNQSYGNILKTDQYKNEILNQK